MSAITDRLPAGLPRDRTQRMRVLNVLLGLLLVVGAVVAYLLVGQSTTTPSAVRTATVSKAVKLASVSGTGTLQAPLQVTANFTTSGKLVTVDVKEGQQVQTGQRLGSIAPTAALRQVSQAEA